MIDQLNSLSAVTLNNFKFKIVDMCDRQLLILEHPPTGFHVDVSLWPEETFKQVAQSAVPPMVETLLREINKKVAA
jgi:hypothetical protein